MKEEGIPGSKSDLDLSAGSTNMRVFKVADKCLYWFYKDITRKSKERTRI